MKNTIRKSVYGLKMGSGWTIGTLPQMLLFIEDYNEEFADSWRGKISKNQLVKNPRIKESDEIEHAPLLEQPKIKYEPFKPEPVPKELIDFLKKVDFSKYPCGIHKNRLIKLGIDTYERGSNYELNKYGFKKDYNCFKKLIPAK